MNQAYRTERARLRDYLVAIIDTVDGIHRALAHGELIDAARYADDLNVLGRNSQRTVARIQNLVQERMQDTAIGRAADTERSGQ
jgi:hypothetical protein